MTAFISVIVPHLNQHAHLLRCLQSLAWQSYPIAEFEIIVVDNGSTHSPHDIVAGFPNARLEYEERPGPGPARNRGIMAAKGDIYAFIDADCIADNNWLATIATKMGPQGFSRILGGDVRIAVANPFRLTQLEAYESVFAYRQQEYIERQGFSGSGNLAVRREHFEAIGGFAGIEIAEDRDWGQRATKLGYLIDYVPEMIVYHPARTDFAELFEKWDRHIDHDFADYRRLGFGRARWVLYAAAVAISPIFDSYRVIVSDRLTTARDRLSAVRALFVTRLYRARMMVGRALGRDSIRLSRGWNRK